MSEEWPLRRREVLHENRIFKVRADWCVDPKDGREHPFWVLDLSEWVNVIARTVEGDFLLVEQFRFGVRAPSLEMPGGLVDPGEDPAVAAARELVEETGHVAGRIVPLGWAHPNPAMQVNRLHFFAALDCRPATEGERRAQDHAERIACSRASAAQMEAMLVDGRITHVCTLAAWLRYRLWAATEGAAPPPPPGA